jgi:hypothetical protein
MSKLLAIAATLKVILIAASFALARGDMPSVILISAVFNLAHLGAKPSSERAQRDSLVASRSHDQWRLDQLNSTEQPRAPRPAAAEIVLEAGKTPPPSSRAARYRHFRLPTFAACSEVVEPFDLHFN